MDLFIYFLSSFGFYTVFSIFWVVARQLLLVVHLKVNMLLNKCVCALSDIVCHPECPQTPQTHRLQTDRVMFTSALMCVCVCVNSA